MMARRVREDIGTRGGDAAQRAQLRDAWCSTLGTVTSRFAIALFDARIRSTAPRKAKDACACAHALARAGGRD